MKRILVVLLVVAACALAQFVSRNLNERLGSGSLPSTCVTGDILFATDKDPGENLYGCAEPDNWVLLGGVDLIAGTGIVIAGTTISIEDAIIPIYYTGAGEPTIGCAVGRDYYVDTTGGLLYFCKSANVWEASNAGASGGLSTYAFATLPALANGSMVYCSDCKTANPCAADGTGAISKRLNSVWVCN